MKKIILIVLLLLSVVCCRTVNRVDCLYLVDPLCEEDSCEVIDGWCIVNKSYEIDRDYFDEIWENYIWKVDDDRIVSYKAYLPDFVMEYGSMLISGDLYDCEMVICDERHSRTYSIDRVGRRMLLEELIRLFPDDDYLKEFEKEVR